jgi:hypothetical protein
MRSRRRRGGGCCWSGVSGCEGVRSGVESPAETEAVMSGQLALVIETEAVVPAAVWESLPIERRLEVTVRLARLLARLVEAERDE